MLAPQVEIVSNWDFNVTPNWSKIGRKPETMGRTRPLPVDDAPPGWYNRCTTFAYCRRAPAAASRRFGFVPLSLLLPLDAVEASRRELSRLGSSGVARAGVRWGRRLL